MFRRRDVDTFLLEKETRQDYGRELADNMLVRRTVFSDKKRFRALNPSKETKSVEPPDTRTPDTDLAQRYLDSRIKRETITSKSDRSRIRSKTMMADGGMTARRLRDVKDGEIEKRQFSTHDVAEDELGDAFKERLRIAAVGFRVKVSPNARASYFNEDLCAVTMPNPPQVIGGVPDEAGISELGRTELRPGADIDLWTETVCNHIHTAMSRGSQFVVLPEFALPPDKKGEQLDSKILDLCKSACKASTHEHFVFAGSRHEGGYNWGLTLSLPNNRDLSTKGWHYKLVPAYVLGENVLGPRGERYPRYQAKVRLNKREYNFNVTVAICYDSFDPTNFLQLVLQRRLKKKKPAEEIILVPSFNRSSVFVEYLRDLSFLTASTVVYVNGLHGDAKMFIRGFSVSDLLDEGRSSAFKKLKDHADMLHNSYVENMELRDTLLLQKKFKESDRHGKDATRISQVKTKVESLLNALENVEAKGGFKHLLTVEPCEACKDRKRGHTNDYMCNSDILYYNLDTRIFDAVATYYENYIFQNDTFLPEPLQQRSITKLFKDLEESLPE
jgi:hypothetical protein